MVVCDVLRRQRERRRRGPARHEYPTAAMYTYCHAECALVNVRACGEPVQYARAKLVLQLSRQASVGATNHCKEVEHASKRRCGLRCSPRPGQQLAGKRCARL